MPDSYSKNIVYLSKAQYQTLIANNTLTVDGVTITYNADDIYVTPQDTPVTDVKIDNVSITSDGVANVPIANASTFGVVKTDADYGTTNLNNRIAIQRAADDQVKTGTQTCRPIVPYSQHASTFYGLAKAAGADMASSNNAVGTYTAAAKTAIQTMLGIEPGVSFVETVSGTTPTITGEANVRYICGEVTSISITPPQAGTIDVIFETGSTPPTLTVPNTVKFPSWFDPTDLEADTIYELNISEGVYGAVMTWPA